MHRSRGRWRCDLINVVVFISRIYPESNHLPLQGLWSTPPFSLLGLSLQSLLLQSVLSTAARVILWKCDCAAALFKLSNGCFSCSVKARFSTLVYKVPHTLAPPLPGLAPCTPFLTLFVGWAPLFLEVPSPLPSPGLLPFPLAWVCSSSGGISMAHSFV